MAAKYPTTSKDVSAPFVKRTAQPVQIGDVTMTVHIRKPESGEKGKWIASAGGVEASGQTLDAAIDAAIIERVKLDAERETAAIEAQTPAQEVDVPSVADVENEESAAIVAETPAESVSLSGVLSAEPIIAPVKVKKSKGKGKKGSKITEAVENGTAVKAPAPVAVPKMTAPKVAALVESAYRTCASAATRALSREISADAAAKIIDGEWSKITEDIAHALRDGVDADQVERLRGYSVALVSNHAAVIGKGGTKLTPAQSKRARAKLGKIVTTMGAQK
jgi:hypothetical protein